MKALLAALGWVLLREERTWARAIAAELDSVPAGAERVRLALSGAAALIRIAGDRAVSRWMTDLPVLVAAAACGVVVGWIDVASASRWPLRLLVVACCGGLGAARPRSALISGAFAGVAIALTGRFVGSAGPYAFDPGDAWWPVVPAMMMSGIGAFVSRRVSPIRHDETA